MIFFSTYTIQIQHKTELKLNEFEKNIEFYWWKEKLIIFVVRGL
jgi:hypothetical protein